MSELLVRPLTVRARQAVSSAIQRGKMPRAATLICTDCGGPAEQYDHHQGYEREFWLKVEPVCCTCHVAREVARGKYAKPFGTPTHGSASTYQNWGCRCDPCRAANTAKARERRVRLRGAA